MVNHQSLTQQKKQMGGHECGGAGDSVSCTADTVEPTGTESETESVSVVSALNVTLVLRRTLGERLFDNTSLGDGGSGSTSAKKSSSLSNTMGTGTGALCTCKHSKVEKKPAMVRCKNSIAKTENINARTE